MARRQSDDVPLPTVATAKQQNEEQAKAISVVKDVQPFGANEQILECAGVSHGVCPICFQRGPIAFHSHVIVHGEHYESILAVDARQMDAVAPILKHIKRCAIAA